MVVRVWSCTGVGACPSALFSVGGWGGLVVDRIVDARGSWFIGLVLGVFCVGRLVPVSLYHYWLYTSGLSTQWSAGGLPPPVAGGVETWSWRWFPA